MSERQNILQTALYVASVARENNYAVTSPVTSLLPRHNRLETVTWGLFDCTASNRKFALSFNLQSSVLFDCFSKRRFAPQKVKTRIWWFSQFAVYAQSEVF